MNERDRNIIKSIPLEKMPFVRMPCGCIGIKLHEDFYISFKNCDSAILLAVRQHNPLEEYPGRGPFFEPITPEELMEIIDALRRDTYSAASFHSLISTLRHYINK